MDGKYKVTYKVARAKAKYMHEEKEDESNPYKIDESKAGHMWYTLTDDYGSEQSYGFESKNRVPYGEGNVTKQDDMTYLETSYEITLELSRKQYSELLLFSEHPEMFGFNNEHYDVLTNSCVDFVFNSLKAIGYNKDGFEGQLFPADNIDKLHDLLFFEGANIIRDDIRRNDDCYTAKDIAGCIWLSPDEKTSPPQDSLINIDINTSPQPQTSVQNENQARQDVANGYIVNAATHKVLAFDDLLNKTDFTSTQMASLATGGIRPGEIQLDLNLRPDYWLSEFYRSPDDKNNDVGLLNGAALNGLSAMTTFNTYIDPLLLDVSGKGAHMATLREGVLFDMDHSGTLKRSGWAGKDTGILVIDDGSGDIKDVSQMFSEYYAGKAGKDGAAGEKKFSNGFAALASEDTNRDGVIDSRDAIWSQLRVWIDDTQDAKVNAGELKTLEELGITQIRVAATAKEELRDGNRVMASGSFTMNGHEREILAVDFLGDTVSNTLDTTEAGTKITSTDNGVTTTGWVSQSKTGETLDAARLGVNNLYGGSGDDTLIAAPEGSWLAAPEVIFIRAAQAMMSLLSALPIRQEIFTATVVVIQRLLSAIGEWNLTWPKRG